jgi:hypothetical protein
MRNIIFIICIIVFTAELHGQTVTDNLPGKVSFISSQNVYVKFKSTVGISASDTLYMSSNGKLVPVLLVSNLSSVSCLCTPLSAANLSVGQDIIARHKITSVRPKEKIIENVVKEIPVQPVAVDSTINNRPYPNKQKQNIRGSISAYSYSDFSNTSAANSTQFRYTFTLDARNIGNSKISVDSYISFRHKLGEWNLVKSDIFNVLKIYTLAIKYDLNKTTQISLGRKINPNISSIGAMDGLQVEKSFNRLALGALVGSRPDYTNYGFDSKLFQYGAYLAFNSVTAVNYFQNSLAFMQQMNNYKTDRRFLYFQHSNSLLKNVYFFSSFEIDLYKLKNDLPQNTFDLTSLYLSLRYKMTKNFTITGSYDARKNVMYYETYKTLIDQIIETEMRQSFRLQANYRITRNLMFGLQSGYRFLKSDPHPSKNLYSYLTYSQIPGLNISVTISATYLESNYMNGKIAGVSLSRDLFQGKLQTGLGYRYIDYKFPESGQSPVQNIGEMNIYWQFSRSMSLSVNYEGTFEKIDKYNRLYLQIRKRF